MTDPAVESHQAILFNMQEHSVESSATAASLKAEIEAQALKSMADKEAADQALAEKLEATPAEEVSVFEETKLVVATEDSNLEVQTAESLAEAQSEKAEVQTSAADEDEAAAALETLAQEDFELAGADIAATQEEIIESETPIIHKAGNVTLPAALCDDELLTELAGIPSKMGFKIGEVAEMLGIKQYVLRYWETEFDVLKPKKAANNQRYYTKKDVENVYLIRKLLHRDRFSIEGARSALKDLKNVVKKEKDWSSVNHKVENLQERVENFIVDLRKLRKLFEA